MPKRAFAEGHGFRACPERSRMDAVSAAKSIGAFEDAEKSVVRKGTASEDAEKPGFAEGHGFSRAAKQPQNHWGF